MYYAYSKSCSLVAHCKIICISCALLGLFSCVRRLSAAHLLRLSPKPVIVFIPLSLLTSPPPSSAFLQFFFHLFLYPSVCLLWFAVLQLSCNFWVPLCSAAEGLLLLLFQWAAQLTTITNPEATTGLSGTRTVPIADSIGRLAFKVL